MATKNNRRLSIINYQLIVKEFRHIFRDTRSMLILLAMPVVQIILFGFAITNEVKNAQVAVFDPSKDAATTRLTERIHASRHFDVVWHLSSAAEAGEVFKEGRVNLVVVFSENFGENIWRTGEATVQLIADATDPNQAVTLTGYASSIIADYRQELLAERSIPIRVKAQVNMLYNPQLQGAYNFVPGVMGMILILICAMMTAISVVREKETGTMDVLLVSPVKPLALIFSKLVPYFALSVVNLITILLLSVYVLNVPVSGSLLGLTALSLLYIFVSLALGMLISTLVATQVAAMLASSMALMLPVMLLSGMMFPTENMPAILQWLSSIVPARWYIAGVKKLMIEGLPIASSLKEIAILSLMAVALMTASFRKLKNEH
ncbi:MAG: ABC transporter permease [Prevotellaceae bacterium]|jgi:ABC-2 type transport system permease protein|nr:ABC transporter permease [Prevotellaceae bacterium]